MSDPLASTPLLYDGKIPEDVFRITVAVLLGICWTAAAVRFYVRISIQKSVSIDDGFLLLGLCCQTVSTSMVFTILDEEYAAESFLLGQTTLMSVPQALEYVPKYLSRLRIYVVLNWIAICCVKLSFLFLFRRLIERLHYMMIYWWVVLVYIVITLLWGVAGLWLMCTATTGIAVLECVTQDGEDTISRYSIAQVVLDLVGDILLLAIPVYVIWTIKIGRKQKFWLATSLCLTIVMIAVTPLRVAGLRTPSGQLDNAWQDFWNLISAEVGLTMTSATAFRTLYRSKSAKQESKQTPPEILSRVLAFVGSSKRLMLMVAHPRSWMSRKSDNLEKPFDTDSPNQSEVLPCIELRTLPRAHMTGIRTVVLNAENSQMSASTVNTMSIPWEEDLHDHPEK